MQGDWHGLVSISKPRDLRRVGGLAKIGFLPRADFLKADLGHDEAMEDIANVRFHLCIAENCWSAIGPTQQFEIAPLNDRSWREAAICPGLGVIAGAIRALTPNTSRNRFPVLWNSRSNCRVLLTSGSGRFDCDAVSAK
jgi:hypothetical protein